MWTAATRAAAAAARGVRSPVRALASSRCAAGAATLTDESVAPLARAQAAALQAAGGLRGRASWVRHPRRAFAPRPRGRTQLQRLTTHTPAGAQAHRLLLAPTISWLRGRRAPSLVSLTVQQKVDRQWQHVQWRFASPQEFALYLRHGQLHEVDAGGRVVRSVVRMDDLREGATYMFRAATDTTDVAGAVKSLASGHERESTAALARDARLTAALGPLRLFNGGEPFTFAADGVALLQVDGLLLCERHPLMLLNEAKLTPLAAHVTEVRLRCSALETLLRGPAPAGVTNWPSELDGYRAARVLPCLSGVYFAPVVQAYALAAGVVPVVCSGARFHVSPEATSLLQPAS
jgi:hypothetical protein